MKIQLQAQSLRVRVDEDELSRLLAGESLRDVHAFGASFVAQHRLGLADTSQPRLDGTAADWSLWLPRTGVEELAARLPSREGVAFELAGPGAPALAIRFDVDVRDSARRRRGDMASQA